MPSAFRHPPPLPAVVTLLGGLALLIAWTCPVWTLEHVAGYPCSGVVCTDDASHLQEATELYATSLAYVTSQFGRLDVAPPALFCHTPGCYRFAFHDGSAAKTLGNTIIVISPRGWQPHFVRHELIHRLQAQTLGVLGMYRRPEWYLEGMAYSLSADPRETLAEPYQTFRTRFRDWYGTVGKRQLWSATTAP